MAMSQRGENQTSLPLPDPVAAAAAGYLMQPCVDIGPENKGVLIEVLRPLASCAWHLSAHQTTRSAHVAVILLASQEVRLRGTSRARWQRGWQENYDTI